MTRVSASLTERVSRTGLSVTPALVAPIEFTLKLSDYAALGGHMDHVRPLASLKDNTETRQMPYIPGQRA